MEVKRCRLFGFYGCSFVAKLNRIIYGQVFLYMDRFFYIWTGFFNIWTGFFYIWTGFFIYGQVFPYMDRLLWIGFFYIRIGYFLYTDRFFCSTKKYLWGCFRLSSIAQSGLCFIKTVVRRF